MFTYIIRYNLILECCDDLDAITQYAAVQISTFESFVRRNIPKKNGKYALNVPKCCPSQISAEPLFATRYGI